jgi:hypothetical protein
MRQGVFRFNTDFTKSVKANTDIVWFGLRVAR